MSMTRWAVLGPGAISRDFAAGLAASSLGVLHAVGSSVADRAAGFAADHGVGIWGDYDAILTRDDVDAVYIGTVHTTHADLAIRALEAGKAVLCEKPATPTLTETERMLSAAYDADRPLVEAFKNRFGPFADTLRRTVADAAEGALGAPVALEASFGFAAGRRTGRLFDPALAGGAILDVGCYPLSLAVEVARVGRAADSGPTLVEASGTLVEGVDGDATAVFDIGGLEARLSTAIVRQLPGSAVIRCERGEIVLPDAWGGRAQSASTIIVRTPAGERVIEVPTVQPMGAEADAVTLALAERRLEAPEMPWADTRAIAAGLTEWRAAVIGGGTGVDSRA
ncbi:putative dehydrogenase [Microbacterium terrae]|uniref:1,5-anhydro-D-fructose reductase n=1 Tax=Microbacterium terrae TaxID=69369 RepID=A0A0M2HEK7_9MICO|nr:Gfo/Idh/MocA family oxidoreductase [Microbacterium terrae]KJL42648.1 1,5-anhydro-D-fructose reductase [Microbacterium terrae]MBP1079078.1 putative dehydrogenase [Microbacterium terrae]GLJ98478.1 hypothetical protein GCM10017594_16750 [Microbacterium terrae]